MKQRHLIGSISAIAVVLLAVIFSGSSFHDAVMNQLSAHDSAFRECASEKAKGLGAAITFDLTKEGRFANQPLVTTSAKDERIVSCIQDKLQKIGFEAPRAGVAGGHFIHIVRFD